MNTETTITEDGFESAPQRVRTFQDDLNDAIERHRIKLRVDEARIAAFAAWIETHRDKMTVIGIAPDLFGEFIDFNRPSREQVLLIIKAFPGKWEKSKTNLLDADDVGMDYVLRQNNGPTLRIWAGPIPPSCRVVEEEIDVPARKEVRKRIVCK